MTPSIKGIFVNSHIKAVRQAKGQAGVDDLGRRLGRPLKYKNNDNVPVADEVAMINAALDIISDSEIAPADRDFEASRLHFRNFLMTPIAKFIFSVFRKKFKLMMLNADNIAGHIFQGASFSSSELSPTSVKVSTQNNNYPIDHFRGLLYEWMKYSDVEGVVEAREIVPGEQEYIIHWQ